MNISLLDGGRFALGLILGVGFTVLFFVSFDRFTASIVGNDAIFGAVVGGLLAGFFALLATLIAYYQQAKIAELQEKSDFEIIALTVFSNVHSILEQVVKHYRHHFDGNPSLRLHYGEGKSFTKPLLTSSVELVFSAEEKNLGLHIKNTELFNLVMDAEGLAKKFEFLRVEYERRFFIFQSKIYQQNPTSVIGKNISVEAVVDRVELLELESISGHFSSLLLRGQKDIKDMHTSMISILEKNFKRKIEFEVTDVTSQARNYFD